MCLIFAITLSSSDQAQELRRVVVHMLAQRLLTKAGPDRPVDDLSSRLREKGLSVRIVRLVHQDVFSQDVDARLGHRRPFKGLRRAAEAAHLHILYGGILQLRRHARDITVIEAEADDPIRQPAVSDLRDAGAEVRCPSSPRERTPQEAPMLSFTRLRLAV